MNSEIEENKVKAKKIFITLLITSLTVLVIAIVGIIFSFVYMQYLGLYQSLIVGGAMVILVALAVLTTVWYNKAYKD